MDSGADTHVFGKGWIPLFEQGVHTPTADLIGFDEVHARKKELPIGPHTALVKTIDEKYVILRADHGVSNPTAKHILLCSFECREMGIIVDDCHKRHNKSIDGTKGTQSIQFQDKTSIDLIFKAALMTFVTEKLAPEDLENNKYPIYDIAIPDWNPKMYVDDPMSINNLGRNQATVLSTKKKSEDPESNTNEVPTVTMNWDNFKESIYNSGPEGTTMEVPWDLPSHYDENDEISVLKLMGINNKHRCR